MEAISDTADRAAKLTAQLLAFARRQALRPEVFNAAEQLEAVSGMLKSVLGSRVGRDLQLVERNACVEADVSQFETALVNLAANARDAMEARVDLQSVLNAWARPRALRPIVLLFQWSTPGAVSPQIN